ncbi:MAG: penicillin-binding protein 2 [Micrococcales bacterium]|nr:penicillin-binding protein 2 [Micrococcales bacterium]
MSTQTPVRRPPVSPRAPVATGRDRLASPPAPLTRRPPSRPPVVRPPAPARPVEAGSRRRVVAIVVVVALILAGCGVRLVYLQVIEGPTLAQAALKSRLMTVTTLGQRGQITDANGVPLAVTVDRYDVAVDQTQMAKYQGNARAGVPAGAVGVAQQLAPLLGLDPAVLGGSLIGTSRFKYVAKGVEPGVARQIRSLGLACCVSLTQVEDRTYPKGTLAGNILGFVNSSGQGAQGLEYQLNAQLSGKNGSETYEIGVGGQQIPGGYDKTTAAVAGSSVRLTLLSDVQWKAQQAANAQQKAAGADAVTIVVMDAHTGAIYAIADSGSIDPNNPGAAGAGALSRAASEVFEPGSTGKIVTMAGILENGLATPTSRFTVPGTFTTPNGAGVIKDAETHGNEQLTLTGILAESSNVGTVMVGQHLSVQQRYDDLSAFGFGAKTNIGMPGESQGILRPVAQWDGRTQYNVLFGQGVSVTALQAVGVYATVANGGVKVDPHLIAGWTAPGGSYQPVAYATGDRVISQQTSSELMTMLQSVVDDGTGNLAAIPGYRVAGKTGTAQEMSTNGITASFIGVVPADSPSIVVGVFVSNPKSSIYGGTVAAPVFADVAGFTLSDLGIAPSGTTVGTGLYPTTW